MAEEYKMNFNQDFTSVSVLTSNAFRLFAISATNKIDEIFSTENSENIRIVERLFNSSLVVLVTALKPKCLRMLHFKKKQEICNCSYPSDILCIRMNRCRLVVCLAKDIHIHDIRNMKVLNSIKNIPPNELGLCSLSLNSHLAFPISTTTGELRIFNVNKMKTGLIIKAHDSVLSALNFSSNGSLLATASERGTVIRVFCVKNGQRIQEFRRGVKRCVRIASLVFSNNSEYLCASSNTETVHIFKIDSRAVDMIETKCKTDHEKSKTAKENDSKDNTLQNSVQLGTQNASTPSTCGSQSWLMGGYLTKAVTSYLLPSQIGDILAQDRAFATAVLAQPGLKHVCGLARIQKEPRLLIASEDGFLYVYDFNTEKGGACKLLHVHDLRGALEGVIELNIDKCSGLGSSPNSPTTPSLSPQIEHFKELITPNFDTAEDVAVIIENSDIVPDNSYASVLKGDQMITALTESAKFRKLCDAIDTPSKLFDEQQFPPVAIAAKE
uniref:Anaphase-promoting complex subunit 4 WD40 domain-containing protein n=1 Tax=Glossina brevipalpis TaxID=37001 RepID=A0A1A9W2V6_9MUSC